MENPWIKLPEASPFVLEIDEIAISQHNQIAKQDHQVILEMYPEPFIGNNDADIVILNLNPGFGGEEDLENHINHQHFINLLKGNLNQDKLDYPFFFLDPRISATPGYKWWNARLKKLVGLVGRKKLSKSILCVEYFPYHSKRYNYSNQVLNSQSFSFQLVRNAVKRGALIVCFRSLNKWKEAVPELEEYENLYKLNNPRAVYLTPNNCPDGFEAILSKMKVSNQSPSTKNKNQNKRIIKIKEDEPLPKKEMPLTDEISTRMFRQSIIDEVSKKIGELGLQKYISVPNTSDRKITFNAHLTLTRKGKERVVTVAANPTKQIIHPDLLHLEISDNRILGGFNRDINLYKRYAIEMLRSYIAEIGI